MMRLLRLSYFNCCEGFLVRVPDSGLDDKQKITFHIRDSDGLVVPPWDYKVAPTTFQPITRHTKETHERELLLMRSVLVPHFAKSLAAFKGFSTITVRSAGDRSHAGWTVGCAESPRRSTGVGLRSDSAGTDLTLLFEWHTDRREIDSSCERFCVELRKPTVARKRAAVMTGRDDLLVGVVLAIRPATILR